MNEDLQVELESIESQLSEINKQLRSLEQEKRQLSARRDECLSLIKESMPSSCGGNQRDTTSKWSQTQFEWSSQVAECLKSVFKLESFRPLQLETINVTMSRLDCLCIMPTGGGKSLCFQLPACLPAANQVTLVVSPLVSLVEDQIWSLRRILGKESKIIVETLNGSSSKEHTKFIHDEMLSKTSDLRLLYVTPEKLAKSKMFMNKLQRMYELGRFARLVIDEVHCCSTYGHDFRPDYKFLNVIKSVFPKVSILGLTATATQSVIDDVKKILNIDKCVLFKAPFNRPNLFYEVKQKPASHEDCMTQLADLIRTRFNNMSGIVYCLSQKDTEQVASDLSARGIKAQPYHANLDAQVRSKVHDNWLNNKVSTICATIAFGMGIDKANCRFVIHHSLSKSLENFYQESGRAGRDGKLAHSILFFRFGDVFRQTSMVFTEQTGLENLYSMVNYALDLSNCKRTLIAQHFQDDTWSACDCNKMCDVCSDSIETKEHIQTIECIDECRIVILVLQRQEKNITGNKLVDLVQAELKRAKNTRLNENSVERLLLSMLIRGYLKEDFHFTPYNTICYMILSKRSNDLLESRASFTLSLKQPGQPNKKREKPADDDLQHKMSKKAINEIQID